MEVEIKNIYLTIFLIALFIYLLKMIDSNILSFHTKLEGFVSHSPSDTNEIINSPSDKSDITSSPSTTIDTIIPNLSPEQSDDFEKKCKSIDSINNMSFLNETENKNLSIGDFYPSPEMTKSKTEEEMLRFVFTMDLFHQIIPTIDNKWLGIIWFDNRLIGIYITESLSSKNWILLNNSTPDNMIRPVFISYDKDRKLLGIFEEKNNNILEKRRFHLYKKKELDIESEWEHVEKTKIVSILYDLDDIMLGLDIDGKLYKKTDVTIHSAWNRLDLNFKHIPMRKLLFDYASEYMIGIGTDFRIYKKTGINWRENEWDEPSPNTLSGLVRDICYDYDGHLIGLSRVGLVKKKDKNYLSQFKLYKEDVKQKSISIFKLLYAITGIKEIPQYDSNNINKSDPSTINNKNDVYVDGKKISEYKFKDPRLNNFLQYRMNLKKQCRKVKAIRIQEEADKMEEDRIRNDKFNEVLSKQKDTIDNLLDTISVLKERTFQE